MNQRRRPCLLFADDSAAYCDSDAAYLCWDYDAAVHGANFLVARHVRPVACAACRSLEDGARHVSGSKPRASGRAAFCHSCELRPPAHLPSLPDLSILHLRVDGCGPTAGDRREAAPAPED